MKKNIFVMGLEPYNRAKLNSIRNAEDYEFHPLLPYEDVVKPYNYPYEELLAKADARLRNFNGTVDGIITPWNFPSDTIAAVLGQRFNLPFPSLESILRCGHKYWARLEQQKIIPDYIPRFCVVNPFSENPFDEVTLDFPFWIKPIKSMGSYLGFRVNNEQEFHESIDVLRREIPRIGNAYNLALKHAQLPPEVEGIGGNHCIVEEIITGNRQNGPEGYVYDGKVVIYGITDSLKDSRNLSFSAFQYPSEWPEHMQQKTIEITTKLVENLGLDNSCFNLEFIWNEETDELRLIEINPRISQSLSDMFEKVHGASNHEVAVDLAMGREPAYALLQGKFSCAAKFMMRCYEDAIVKRVPTAEQIAQAEALFPETGIYIAVEEGMQLSDLKGQDSYSFEIATIMVGADSHKQLQERYQMITDTLNFEFEPVKES